VEVVLIVVIGMVTIRAETATAMTLSTPDRITTTLHKQATDTEMIVMEGAAVGATFSVVFTVLEDTRVGVEIPIRVLIHQGRHTHHRALHTVLIPTQGAMVLKAMVTEGSHILGIQIPVDITPTAVEIDTMIIHTVRIGAIQEIIHTTPMGAMVVDRVQAVDTEDTGGTGDIQTKPATLREVRTVATREVEEESDEAEFYWEGFINLLLHHSCLMYLCPKIEIKQFLYVVSILSIFNNRHPFPDCVFSESLQEGTAWGNRLQEEQSPGIRKVVQHIARPYALDSQLEGQPLH